MIKEETINQAKDFVARMVHKVDKNKDERNAIDILNNVIEQATQEVAPTTTNEETQ